MAHEVVELTSIKRPPQGREEVPVQLSGLLEAHEIIDGSNDLAEPLAPNTTLTVFIGITSLIA